MTQTEEQREQTQVHDKLYYLRTLEERNLFNKEQEQIKEYREESRERAREQVKQDREQNADLPKEKGTPYKESYRDKMEEHAKQQYTCNICHKQMQRCNKSRHEKTQERKDNLNPPPPPTNEIKITL